MLYMYIFFLVKFCFAFLFCFIFFSLQKRSKRAKKKKYLYIRQKKNKNKNICRVYDFRMQSVAASGMKNFNRVKVKWPEDDRARCSLGPGPEYTLARLHAAGFLGAIEKQRETPGKVPIFLVYRDFHFLHRNRPSVSERK